MHDWQLSWESFGAFSTFCWLILANLIAWFLACNVFFEKLSIMHFCVVCFVNLVNIVRNGESKNAWLTDQLFKWDTVTGNCISWTFSNYLLINFWGNIFESVNHVSDQGSNLSGPLMCGELYLWNQLTSQNVLRSSASPLC